MYGANQIIHAVPFNKPYDLGVDNKDTDWAWGLPPFRTIHYEYVNKKDEPYKNAIWGCATIGDPRPCSVKLANKLLSDGIIRPAKDPAIGTSHYECCGQWKTNSHMWWCENGPRYDRVTKKSSKKTQLETLEDLVLTRKGLRSMGFKWEIPSHLQWLMG